MQRIFVVGIMAFLSLMMTVEASDTTRITEGSQLCGPFFMPVSD